MYRVSLTVLERHPNVAETSDRMSQDVSRQILPVRKIVGHEVGAQRAAIGDRGQRRPAALPDFQAVFALPDTGALKLEIYTPLTHCAIGAYSAA